jgi:hypothetical protein
MDVQATPKLHAAKSPQPPLVVWWWSAILFAALASLCLTSMLEWEHYRRLLRWRDMSLTSTDRLIVLWLLWAKSVLPLLPLLAAAGLLASLGRRLLASVLLVGGATLLYFWLAVDLVMQKVTGNHVFDYLPYLQDALNSAATDHAQWAGGAMPILWRALAVLLVVVASALAILAGSRRLSQAMLGRLAWLRGPSASVACTLLFLVACVAAVPAQAFFSQPLLLRRLHTALPVDLALFVPAAANPSTFAGLLHGGHSKLPVSGVRIVSVLPDPAGEDPGKEQATLHNFSAAAVSLEGWQLEDSAKHRHALSGNIASQQTITITLPVGTLDLANTGDEVRLIDASGQQRHRVKYKGDWVKYGGVIAFREEHDLDDFLMKMDQGLQSVYYTMHEDVLTARPADETAHVAADNPPNVIYLVLESFRASAVSPELMSRLDAWGSNGLRLKRHYAGSNSSHLGMFSLLYGRSPLVYYPTVNAYVPPQTPLSLRRSGYDLTFVSSGDCSDFRKMDHFLNETHFDRVIVENGPDWRDWPERDRRTLAHVRRLASQQQGKPRFVVAFLMSTHFPYAFPARFDVHQPSATDQVNQNNWSQFDADVLHNRYKNAALSLEEAIMELVDSLDPTRNIIVVTGDHGESMAEDGALAHASRGSEVQTRVPLLMVGPGIEPAVIDEPTTHTDILPTLLHVLAGKAVPVAHAHGRDLLAEPALGQQVMLCPYRWKDPYDLILIRGRQRMQLKVRLDRAVIEAYGFCDTAGNLDLSPEQVCTAADAPQWVEAFRQELLRIVR